MKKIKNKSSHKLYHVWVSMKQRCYNKNCKSYSLYGAKGVVICDEWLVYENFFNWSIENGYQVGRQIDRYPNRNGNYEPLNCRWATPAQNLRNKDNVNRYEFLGNNFTTGEWAAFFDVKPSFIKSRINKYPLHIALDKNLFNKKIKSSLSENAEAVAAGNLIKRIMRKNGRFNKWLIKKFIEDDRIMDDCIFSKKLCGSSGMAFTKSEIDFMFLTFKENNFELV